MLLSKRAKNLFEKSRNRSEREREKEKEKYYLRKIIDQSFYYDEKLFNFYLQ